MTQYLFRNVAKMQNASDFHVNLSYANAFEPALLVQIFCIQRGGYDFMNAQNMHRHEHSRLEFCERRTRCAILLKVGTDMVQTTEICFMR